MCPVPTPVVSGLADPDPSLKPQKGMRCIANTATPQRANEMVRKNPNLRNNKSEAQQNNWIWRKHIQLPEIE